MTVLQFPTRFRGDKLFAKLKADPDLRTRLRALLVRWTSSRPAGQFSRQPDHNH